MHHANLLGALALASVAIAAGPTYGAQTTTDKVEQKATSAAHGAKGMAQGAKTGITDSWLTAKTKIALYADERVKGGEVSVETVKGTVSLRGKVDSDEAKAAAATVAQSVDGVKGVRNDLQVVPPADRKAVDISDKDITSHVQGRLSKDAGLKKVDVRTDGGAVILTGAVSGVGASARASELARGVPGVRAVKNELIFDAPAAARSGAAVTGSRAQVTGSRAQVLATQRVLKEKGFEPGPIDGVMGPQTASALKEYQKAENLQTTGQMDSDTAAKLGVKLVKRQSP
jgi:hyperosmotically inducible protein